MIRLLPLLIFLATLLPLSAQETETASTAPIEVEDITADDAIAQRIREIYDAVGGFESVEISVQSGVVKLSGSIANDGLRDDAVSLASRTDGVVLTLDRLAEPEELTSKFAPAFDRIRQMGRTFVVKLPLIGAAVLILLAASVVSHIITRQRGWLTRISSSSMGRQLALRIVRFTIYLIAILIALELLEATAIVGTLIGAAGLAGIALGFAFKNIVENYLAGVLLSTRNPFEIGDSVEIDGHTGKIALLTARDTVLVTFEGNHLRIPNGVVMNSTLLNFSRNPLRRFDFYVGVSTDFDLAEVKRIASETLKHNPAVLTEPTPTVIVDSLGDSSVMMRIFAWIDQSEHDLGKAKSESIRLIKETFDEEGIEMPEPIYRLHIREGASMPRISATPEKPKSKTPTKPAIAADLTTDKAIDNQIKEEARTSGEENLLKET